MSYQYIDIRVSDRIVYFKLNRPEKHNAISLGMLQEFSQALDEIEQNESVYAVFVLGNMEAFSAGGDLMEMQELNFEDAEKRSRLVQDTFRRLANLEVPVIAFIEGIAFGGGLELALHCDFRVSSRSARFTFPESKFGIIPGGGGTVLFPQIASKGDASYYLLTGHEIPIDKAYDLGIVQKVVYADELEKEMDHLACYFSACSLDAIKAIKRMIKRAKPDLSDNYKLEAKEFAQVLQIAGREGIKSKFK